MKPKFFHYNQSFALENGQSLPQLTIAYHIYGKLNSRRNNVIWICHALTADSDAQNWWRQMVGHFCPLNTEDYFVVCANILGSCYGTTGPLSTNPETGEPYYSSFPFITIRDMVNAHELLRRHLLIDKIELVIGGSMGGYQALEWTLMYPKVISNLALLATSARETAWGIAIHTSQRMAIEADESFNEFGPEAGEKGLAAARAMGMISYRNYKQFVSSQTDLRMDKMDSFSAESYVRYHGDKLVKRFNAYSYYTLTYAMDSHNVARKRAKTIEEVLQKIEQPTMIFTMKDDLLCPYEEQKFLFDHILKAQIVKVDTNFGHDGFLVETKQIGEELEQFLSSKIKELA